MTFVWPTLLALLLLLPAVIALYLRLLRRRARRAAELAAQGFVPTASALGMKKRRHIPYVFFLLGLATLLASIARPQAKVSVPRREGTVILAFDVSNSMRADDMKPSRIEAAKNAAREFVKKQPSTIRIGVVAFSDGSLVTQQPTDDRDTVLAALNRLTPQGGTSLGQGIFAALNAIAGKPINVDLSKVNAAAPDPTPNPGGTADSSAPSNPDAGGSNSLDGVDIGYFGSAAIVLLSDGENTVAPDPVELAKLASTAGVKIYPIGVGSPGETVVDIDGFKVATSLDEKLLEAVASVSDGTYFRAEDGQELSSIYDKIDLKWRSVPKFTELTGLFSLAAMGLLFVGAALSMRWFGRPV